MMQTTEYIRVHCVVYTYLLCSHRQSIIAPRVICALMCSQGDALRHALLTLYLGASYNQGLAGPAPAIANSSGHVPPVALPAPDKDAPDAKGGVSLAIRNDLSLVETQVPLERVATRVETKIYLLNYSVEFA